MRRWVIFGVVVVILGAAGAWWLTARAHTEWTTDSPEALAEFEAAMNAQMKLYYTDSERHLERAVKLDPNFVMAKFTLEDYRSKMEPEGRKQFEEFVGGIALDRLNPRERFFVERARALLAGRQKEASRLLDDYLARHGNDPYALNMKGQILWQTGHLDEAKNLFQRLVKIAPNWVVAYNQLGYIAMQQEHFAKAEDYFKTYGFIAPDQANPHDSLGELLTLTGRYDEAVEELRQALKIKPDFCASYDHLVQAHLLMGDATAATADLRDSVERGKCPDQLVAVGRCIVTLWPLEVEHRWQEMVRAAREGGCEANLYPASQLMLVIHLARTFSGDAAGAKELEDQVRKALKKSKGGDMHWFVQSALNHMRGVRAAAAGRYDDAAERLEEADRSLTYLGNGIGLFKLVNRLMWAEALEAGNHPAESEKIIEEVRTVNPSMAQAFESGKWRPLGLETRRATRLR